MLILLETLVIRHFLTLAAQLQQAGVGMSGLLSILVETLILVGMILYLLYSKQNNIFIAYDRILLKTKNPFCLSIKLSLYKKLNHRIFLGGQGVCNITQHQPAPFKTLVLFMSSSSSLRLSSFTF